MSPTNQQNAAASALATASSWSTKLNGYLAAYNTDMSYGVANMNAQTRSDALYQLSQAQASAQYELQYANTALSYTAATSTQASQAKLYVTEANNTLAIQKPTFPPAPTIAPGSTAASNYSTGTNDIAYANNNLTNAKNAATSADATVYAQAALNYAQQGIQLLQAIPASDPNYASAQQAISQGGSIILAAKALGAK
jgi:hypothetical protein